MRFANGVALTFEDEPNSPYVIEPQTEKTKGERYVSAHGSNH